jgi:hypothetical protein
MIQGRDVTHAFTVLFPRVGVGKYHFGGKSLSPNGVLGRNADIGKGEAPSSCGLRKVHLRLVGAGALLVGSVHSECVGHDLELHVIKVALPSPIPHLVVVYRSKNRVRTCRRQAISLALTFASGSIAQIDRRLNVLATIDLGARGTIQARIGHIGLIRNKLGEVVPVGGPSGLLYCKIARSLWGLEMKHDNR